MWARLIPLERGGLKTLQVQIKERIIEAIEQGLIQPDRPMPSSRELSNALGVARNTVIPAYEQLETDGYLKVVIRKGYFINRDVYAVPNTLKKLTQHLDVVPKWLDSKLVQLPSQQKCIVKCRTWRDYDYPFVVGQLDPNLVPINRWRDAVKQSLKVQEIRHWNADFVDQDDADLIQQIQEKILPKRGIWVKKDNILLTAGAQNALYLITSLFVDQEKIVAMENPGYTDARAIFSLRSKQVLDIEVDAQGVVPESIHNNCDVVYTTPSHQYPTGVTMGVKRREALLEKANKNNFIVIEDDYEAENNFTDSPRPALKSINDDRVIYVGSFSKTFAPGLRLGYVVAAKAVIEEVRVLRRLMLRHTPTNNQRAVAIFIGRGYHQNMFNRIHKVYKERWHLLAKAIEQSPLLTCTPTLGGSSFWVEAPKEIDTVKLSERLMECGVIIEPGATYFSDENPPQNFFRLGFSSIKTMNIEAGVGIISYHIETMMQSTPR